MKVELYPKYVAITVDTNPRTVTDDCRIRRIVRPYFRTQQDVTTGQQRRFDPDDANDRLITRVLCVIFSPTKKREEKNMRRFYNSCHFLFMMVACDVMPIFNVKGCVTTRDEVPVYMVDDEMTHLMTSDAYTLSQLENVKKYHLQPMSTDDKIVPSCCRPCTSSSGCVIAAMLKGGDGAEDRSVFVC